MTPLVRRLVLGLVGVALIGGAVHLVFAPNQGHGPCDQLPGDVLPPVLGIDLVTPLAQNQSGLPLVGLGDLGRPVAVDIDGIICDPVAPDETWAFELDYTIDGVPTLQTGVASHPADPSHTFAVQPNPLDPVPTFDQVVEFFVFGERVDPDPPAFSDQTRFLYVGYTNLGFGGDLTFGGLEDALAAEVGDLFTLDFTTFTTLDGEPAGNAQLTFHLPDGTTVIANTNGAGAGSVTLPRQIGPPFTFVDGLWAPVGTDTQVVGSVQFEDLVDKVEQYFLHQDAPQDVAALLDVCIASVGSGGPGGLNGALPPVLDDDTPPNVFSKHQFLDRIDEFPYTDAEVGFGTTSIAGVDITNVDLLTLLTSCYGVPLEDLRDIPGVGAMLADLLGVNPTHSYPLEGPTSTDGYGAGAIVNGTLWVSFLLDDTIPVFGGNALATANLYADDALVGTVDLTTVQQEIAFGVLDDLLDPLLLTGDRSLDWNAFEFEIHTTGIIHPGAALRFDVNLTLLDTLDAGSLHFVGYNGGHASNFTITPADPVILGLTGPLALEVGETGTYTATWTGGAFPYVCHWQTSDPDNATISDPTGCDTPETDDTDIIFLEPGTYTVTFTLIEACGEAKQATLQVVVAGLTGNVSGTKRIDEDGSGDVSAPDTPFAGVTIYIDANNNGQFDAGEQNTTTDAQGEYEFADLPEGDYIIREVVPPGFNQTLPNGTAPVPWAHLVRIEPGSTDHEDRDFLDCRLSGTDSNENGIDDACEGVGPGIISGFKFHDVDGDGIRQPLEPPLAGVAIFIDTDNDGVADIGEPLTVTVANGSYEFTGLPLGTYNVREIVPTGFTRTAPASGVHVVVLTDLQPVATQRDFLNTRIPDDKETFFLHQTSEQDLLSILGDGNGPCVTAPGGILPLGNDADAIDVTLFYENEFMDHHDDTTQAVPDAEPEVILNLLAGCLGIPLEDIDALDDEMLDNLLIDMTPTHSYPAIEIVTDGPYAPGSIVEGDIFLSFLLPEDTLPLGGDGPIATADLYSNGVLVGSAELVGTSDTLVFGQIDDIFDAIGVGDVVPTMANWNHYTLHITTTDWIPANAVLQLDLHLALLDTLPEGSLHFVGYNFDHQSNIRLCPQGAVLGTKYEDLDLDGVGDIVIANVTIYADLNSNGNFDAGEPSTVTDENGEYFLPLAPGAYQIREVVPEGRQQSFPAAGFHFVVINPPGEILSGRDFINRIPDLFVRGFKCNDLNSDGKCVNLDPHVVFVVDTSGSTEDTFPGEATVGDLNGDGLEDSILDAQLAGVLALGEALDARHAGIESFSLVVFGDTAEAVLQFGTFADLQDAVAAVTICQLGCGTNFEDAFAKAKVALDDAAAIDLNSNVVFLSDGLPTRGGSHADEVQAIKDRPTAFLRAFGFEIEGSSPAQRQQQMEVIAGIDPTGVLFDEIEDVIEYFSDADAVLPSDSGVAGFVFFIDEDGDRVLDVGERSGVSDENGQFAILFNGLTPGTYSLCEVQQPAWKQTSPVNAAGQATCFSITLGQTDVGDFVFANFFQAAGKITGFKCRDIGQDGVCDNAQPHAVFVIDVSGSTEDGFEAGEGTGPGDYNNDGLANTILDAELVSAAIVLNDLKTDFGAAAIVSIVLLGETADILDMDPGTQASDYFIDLGGANLNKVNTILKNTVSGGNSGRCINDTTAPCGVGFQTNYEDALARVLEVLGQVEGTPENRNVIFISDGEPNAGGAYDDEAALIHDVVDHVRAYGVGNNAKLPPLQIIDAGAQIVTTASDLQDAVQAGIVSDPPLGGVTIYLDLDGDGVHDPVEPSTVTAADGTFTLTGLDAGEYIVREVVQPGMVQTAPADGFFVVVLGSPTDTVGPLTFANHIAGPGSLAGFKCEDVNGNGVCEEGEAGLGGFVVFLDLDNNGVRGPTEPFVLTSSAGLYAFPGLQAGVYRVCQVVPDGYEQTAPGGDLCHEGVQVDPDQPTVVPDFADRLLTGSLLGFKCLDEDADGVCDDSEPGLPGFTVFLDANGNGQLDEGEPRLTTDDNGNYHFLNMAPGTYRVCQIVPDGFIQTAPGGDGCWEDIPIQRGFVTLPPDFADRVPEGGLLVYTCVDEDRDTTCDDDEPALPGITVGGPGLAPGATGPTGEVFYPGLSVGAHEVCVQSVPVTMEVTGATCKDGIVPSDGQGYVEFTLAFLPAGTVTGYKCQDNNGNGVCDALLLGDAPNVVYIIDVSGSTVDLNTPFEGDENVGDVNSDTISNSILDAQLAAYIGLTQDLIDREVGDRSRIGIVIFSGQPIGDGGPSAAFLDMDPTQAGRQATTTAGADTDASGIPDVMEILRKIVGVPNGQQMSELTAGAVTEDFGQFTNFEAGLQATIQLLQTADLDDEETNVLFLSDGKPNRPSGIEGETAAYEDDVIVLRELAGNVRAFGVGEQTELATLVVIDPDAQIFLRTSELLGLFTGVGEDRVDADPPLPRVMIFADLDGNGVLSIGEPWALTRPSGLFTLEGVPINPDAPFTRRICEVVPPGYTQTAPGTQCWDVRVEANGVVSAPDFADQPTGNLDLDGDGIEFRLDNCPLVFNPDQTDTNGNGLGDVCDMGYGGVSDVDMDDGEPLDPEDVPGDGGVIVQPGPLLVEEVWFWVGAGILAAILAILVTGLVVFARAGRSDAA